MPVGTLRRTGTISIAESRMMGSRSSEKYYVGNAARSRCMCVRSTWSSLMAVAWLASINSRTNITSRGSVFFV